MGAAVRGGSSGHPFDPPSQEVQVVDHESIVRCCVGIACNLNLDLTQWNE
jgi:hypothetical protein